MEFGALLQNQTVVYSGVGFLLLVLGVTVMNKKKRRQIGQFLSTRLNALIGKKNAELVEEWADDIIEGAKEDNKK